MAKKAVTKKSPAAKSATQNYSGIWDNRIGFGKKPAVIVIDLLQGYTLPGAPLYAPGVVKCVKEVPELLQAARRSKVPVLHTRVLYNPVNFEDGGVWIRKAPVLKALVPGNQYAEFCPEVKPPKGETVIVKNYASCFFGTSLAATLTAAGRGYADHHGLHDLGLHPRLGGRRSTARFSADCRARVRWRPARRSAQRQSVRHQRQVWRCGEQG